MLSKRYPKRIPQRAIEDCSFGYVQGYSSMGNQALQNAGRQAVLEIVRPETDYTSETELVLLGDVIPRPSIQALKRIKSPHRTQ